MSQVSEIQWTDATWNIVTGCSKVSPGCANCYIERTPPFRIAGRRFSNGAIPVRLHPDRLEQPLHWRKPRRVFVCSLADLFHDDVDFGFLVRAFATMRRSDQHVFQVLTKRPQRMAQFVSLWRSSHSGEPEPNIWLGVSIENARFTWRADILREIPAAVRFISAEPLLGSLFEDRAAIAKARVAPGQPRALQRAGGGAGPAGRAPLDLSGIDWLIIGGESGPRARPFHLEHARELIMHARCTLQACIGLRADGTCPLGYGATCGARTSPAVFVKQLGAKPRYLDDLTIGVYKDKPLKLRDRKGGDITEFPPDLQVREFPIGAQRRGRVRARAAAAPVRLGFSLKAEQAAPLADALLLATVLTPAQFGSLTGANHV